MALDKLVDSTQLDADLTTVANAIRTKGGTSASLAFPSDFATAIAAIPTGITPTGTISITTNGTHDVTNYASADVNVSGGAAPAEKKQVNFIDYDGTILYSYTAVEANALSALPSNPTHAGLTAQGWNWTLVQIKAQLSDMPDGDVWVGQSYTTVSGDTEIDTVFVDATRLSPILTIAVNGSVTVDWGDNTATDSVSGTSLTTRKEVSHTYATVGEYTIKIHSVSGNYTFYNSSSYTILRKNTSQYQNIVYSNCVRAIRLGSGITSIGDYAFAQCYSLESVTIPTSVTSIGKNAFRYDYSIKSVTIPNSVSSIGDYACSSCFSLKEAAMPGGMTSWGQNLFYFCYSLPSATIPYGVTTFGISIFAYCTALEKISLPSGVTTISNTMFDYCYSLASVTIPSGVTKIGNDAFRYCYGMAEVHVKPTTPPTLGTSPFHDEATERIIFVPSSKLEDYKTASNWSNYASYMQGE